MMKAFSFLTILESLSKKLSILRTKMHSDNLRVDYESITSQLRVNPLFSHCASSGASFALSRRASHFAAILTILFTIGVGSVWGAYDVPANGKVTLSKKVNNGGRFNVEASGVYHFRPASGYSWSDNNGIKTQSNNGGVVFFIDKSTDVTVQIAHSEAKNAHDVTVHVYSITEEEYKQFDDNKGKANEKDRTYTSLSLTNDNPFVIEIAAEQKEFEGTKKLESGYYVIVPTGEKSNTYFKSITFSSSSSGGGDATTPVTGVSLNKTSTTLEIGGTETLTATIEPNNATNKNVTWSSSNTSVATVQNGVVTAVAAGTANITVTTEDGNKTATCAVTVNAASGGGSGDDSYMYFVAEADATANGVKNSQKFTGVPTGDSDAKGSFSFNGKEYTVEKRTGNDKHTIKFEMPDGWTNATLVLVHNQSSRNFTLEHPDKSKETGETKANGKFHENTFTITQSGTYTISNSENIGLIFIGLINNSSASTPTYTVTFNANGHGTAPAQQTITSGGKATTPATPTAPGYTFGGWYKEAGCTNAYDFNTEVTSDITLYAKWTPNANTAYTVKHYKQQLDETYSATPDETDNLTGTTAASVTPAVKSYEGFTAPSTQTVTIAADGTTVVEYRYTRKSYTLTWYLDGGTISAQGTAAGDVKYGAALTAPTVTKTGYTFAGWSPEVAATMPAANTTYTAQWTENAQTYTITYNLGPENWKGENPLPTYTAGTVHTLPTIDNLTNDNYGTFQGWYESADFQGNAVTSIPANATGDKTYYAKWVYSIKFFEVVDEETDVVNKEFQTPLTGASYPATYTYGVGITLPELPAKDGYTADGWYSQWCVYNEQKGWVDACKLKELDNKAYGNVNFAVKYTLNTPVTPDPDPECETTTITYTLVTPNNNTATQNVSGTDKITTLTGATAKGTATANTGVINNSFSDYSVRYGASATNDNVSDGVTFTFDVPSGYVFKPSAINTNLMCYGTGKEGDTQNYEFYGSLSDGTTTINGTALPGTADGADANIVYSDIADKTLSGTVTLRLNAVKVGGKFQSFRIKSPITITGQLCETQTYTISYNANGGSGTMESTTNVVAANTFTREGYTFAGWNTVADGTGTSYAAGDYISSDLTLYAQWEENTPVTPPTQGGEVCVTFEGSSNAISYTSGVFAMYVADSNGRIYTDEESWATGKTDCSGSKVYAFDDNRFLVKVSVPITSIHFSGYSSSERTIESVKTSTTADKGSYSEPALVGDTKIGPTTGCQEFKINFSEAIPANTYIWVELSNAMVISTICYTPAPSTPSTYTVTYECNGATSGCPSNATEQTALPNPLPIPTKTGYEFGGWYTDSELTTAAIAGATLSANITLYAQWTANPSGGGGGETCITFGPSKNVSGSTATTELEKFTVVTNAVNNNATKFGENEDYIIITAKQGYIQKISMDGEQNGIKVTSSTDNTTYSNEQSLLFSNGSELQITTQNVTSIKIMRNGGNVEFSEICITTTPLVTYNVTYKANGGTGDDVTSKVAVVGACPNSFTAPTGKTFKGWNTAADGTGTAYAVGEEVQSDLTLYAQWGVAYTVTYNANGATSGTAPKDNNKYFSGDQVSVLGNISNMTKTNHSFVGWNTQADGSGTAYTAGSKMTMPAANVTLYAVWNNEKCGENYVTWTLPTNNKEFESFSTTQEGLTATASPTNSDVTVASDAKAGLTTKLIPTAETSYLEFKFAVPSGSQFTPCELTLPVQPINSACNFTITVTDGTNTLTRTFTNCAHGSITTLTMNNTSTITFTGDVSIKIYSTGTTHGYRLGSPLSIFGAVVNVQNPCTTPVLPTLAATTVCEGENVSWNAAITNELADGETVEYKWVKSPNTSTILATTAQYQITNATEAATGTYIVSATVSAEGKNRTIAHTQVRLTVTPTTATPTITADKDKVYEGNSVTLTAATASTGVTYQWYTCNADGSNEQEINAATAATYTIASAGAAGTHYYKVIVTGDGTHSCGTAEAIFPLVVSSSNSGQTTCAEIAGQFASGVYNLDTDFVLYGVDSKGNLDTGVSSTQGTSRCGGEKGWFLNRQRFAVTFPVDVVSFSFMGYQSNDRTIKNVKTTAELLSEDTEYQTIKYTSTVTKENNCQTFVVTPENTITAGTIVWIDLSNALNISEICYVPYSDVACTDPDVTATVDNATICEGNESTVTFTATGAADGATFQWQKKNGNAWELISEATFDNTYTISSVTTAHAGQYRVIATKECSRTSEEIKLTVLTAPEFNDFAKTASVMQTTSLVIDDVEATGATSYAWYKSADATFNSAEDTQIGTAKALTIQSVTEAAESTFYLFCVATNSCGSTTSSAIAVNVTALVEEECATKGNEGGAELFTFLNTGCGNKEVDSKKVWSTSSRSKYLTYTTIEGKYFETAKVQIAHSESKKAAYAYSTDGGTNWAYVEIPASALSNTLSTYTITFEANVNAFRIGRNFTASDGEKGSTSGTFYLYEACFTYKNACTATTLTPDNASQEYTMGGDADFTEPTFTLKAGETPLTPDNGAITYSSSNTAIATVGSDGNVHFEGMTGNVTITATYAGGTIGGTEYCECTGSYTITVSCQDEDAPIIVAANGTNMSECNASITLEAKMQDLTDFDSGSYQWYRNGVAIDGATAKAYTATQSGTYTVVHYGKCDQWSTNKAVITNDNSEPSVERLAPFQYYHVDKTYSDQMKDRHLFAVKSYGRLDNGKRYQLSATRNGSPWDISTSTSFFVITSADNAVDTIMLDLNQMKGKFTEGDNIVITCNPVNSCNALSTISESITIKVIDQTPTLALICSGAKADGSGTRTTDQMTVGGDFLTGYNPADLCQQTENRAFDATKEWGFYTVLKENYIVVPVNGYATFNKLNYEPFDILLLTDYPKTGHSEAAQKIIDDMSDLCDYRPLLSFKTHFQSTNFVTETGEFKYNKWTKKGFTTAPVVPAQPALYADIVCYAHPMFDAISDVTASEDFYHNADDHDQLVYKILSQAGHEGSKGMQGFELADAVNFVTIGLIHNDASAAEVKHDNHEHVKWTSGANDRQLVAIAERQANIEARMILFSINCGAQSMQTEGGRQVILQCLKYLYDPEVTDPELIVPADCHLTFDNKTGDGKWSTAGNWAPGYKVCPTANSDVRIAAPCTVDIADAEALSVQIVEGGSLTIGQGAALNVTGPIIRFDKETNTSSPTESEDIFIGSVEAGNGTLIFNNNAGTTKATVQMYSTAKADTEGYSAAASTWQYIGTPHSDVKNAVTNYYNSWLYQYDTGKEDWVVIPNGGPLVPFKGYCITHPETPHTYTMTGTLVTTLSQSIDIPAEKYVVVANSWTAPIQVANFADADLENIKEKTVYLFNTGSDPEGDNDITTPETAESTSRYAANTYVAMPIHAATYIGCSTIPSMQGFYVVGGETDGQLHLDYDQLVRPQTGQSIVGEPMHAPARRVAADDEPQVAKFLFRGKRYDDRLIILERPDFTRGYDSGWDGEQWGGNAAAPMSYVVTETRWDAVSAIPEYEGTVIGFRAGEDSEYTIHFDYDGMEDALYLLDTDTQIYTRVLKGNSYTFTCADKAEHNRFILTRKAPQIATGTEHINTGENAKAVKFIKDDKIFIFVNGMLYDATGKMVIR
ncbi:MAG: InlB B-repeat-containing protein [Paludibacteraceae bacterium]|nr:InlB B-repeat-containing protein [Paludibacteraceae bacterium]